MNDNGSSNVGMTLPGWHGHCPASMRCVIEHFELL